MLPHIAKTIYAPLCNFFVWLVLGSSIAAIFGVEELTGRAINISTSNLRHIETFSVVAVIYVVLDIRGEHRAGARRPLGISRQGEGVLMLDRLIEEVPRFFNYYNMIFMLQAMLRTLALTVVGCTVGFSVRARARGAAADAGAAAPAGAARGDRLRGSVPAHSVPGDPVHRALRRAGLCAERLALQHRADLDLPALHGLPLRGDPRRAGTRSRACRWRRRRR